MKINIANPIMGLQKQIEVDEQQRLLPFYEKKIGEEVSGDTLGDEFKNSVLVISGGSDKEGFPMMQGVLTKKRVKLLFRDLLKKGTPKNTQKTGEEGGLSKLSKLAIFKAQNNHKTLQRIKHFKPRKTGQMKRKSIRGCIVGADLAVLNLILKKSNEIEGLTDRTIPRRLGPKRASHIKKLFNLSKKDDITKFVVHRKVITKNGVSKLKAPKIQRIITPQRIQRKRSLCAKIKKNVTQSQTMKKVWLEKIKNFQSAHKTQKTDTQK